MIDKFNLKKNIPEEELLSYVFQVANEYCPDVDVDDDGDAYFYPPDYAIFTFKRRYNNNELDCDFNYEGYIKNKNIQDTLSGLRLDSEKFWYLLLFIFDYTRGNCLEGFVRKDTPKEQLTKLIDSIFKNIKNVNPILKATSYKPIKLTLSIEGERDLVIDNSTVLFHLARFCSKELNRLDGTEYKNTIICDSLNYGEIGDEPQSESNSVHIWYFAKMFIKFFELNPQIKARAKKGSDISYNKLLLISRLVYFARLSRNKNFKVSDDTLKGYLKQYKDYKVNKVNDIYFS
jgi:hypothetical protein